MIIISEPVKIENLKQIDITEPDDIFILCASPEDRCKGVINLLSPEYKTKNIFLIRYEHPNLRREENIRYITNKLKRIGEISEFCLDENKPLPIINEIVELI